MLKFNISESTIETEVIVIDKHTQQPVEKTTLGQLLYNNISKYIPVPYYLEKQHQRLEFLYTQEGVVFALKSPFLFLNKDEKYSLNRLLHMILTLLKSCDSDYDIYLASEYKPISAEQ